MSVESRSAAGTIVRSLAPAVSDDGLRYCILHGWESLPEVPEGEVDIAITADDIRRLEARLQRFQDCRVVQLLEYEAASFCFVLATRQESRVRFLALDTAIDYRQDGCVLLAAKELLRDRQCTNGLWVAGESTEFAYLLVKKILKRAVPEHQKARLQTLSAAMGGAASSVASRLFGPQWGLRVHRWVACSEWAALEKHLGHLRRALLWQTVKRDPLGPLRYWLADYRRRWRRWTHPTGLCVAVVGPDEAARGALIAQLREQLAGAFRQTVVIARGSSCRSVANGGSVPLLSRFSPAFGVGALCAALARGIDYVFKVRPFLVRSALVLIDRGNDHLLTSPPRSWARGVGKIVHRLLHWPDLYLFLEVGGPPLTGGSSPRRLAEDLPAAVVLEGSRSVDETAQSARDVVLDYLHRRYMHRRSLWFPHTGADTLTWLTEILCLSPAHARFEFLRDSGMHDQPLGPSERTFGWLSLKSGRGYLIPLESRRAAVKALDLYNAKRPKARLAKGFMALGLAAGLGGCFLRKVQLAVRQDGHEHASAVFLEYLQQVLGRRDVAVAISLGTPSPHRKPVLLALSGNGTPLAYVKVGSTDVTNAFVRHEVDMLRDLSHGAFQSFDVPRLLHAGWWNGRYVCVQAALSHGKTQGAPERLTPQYVAISRELAAFATRRQPLGESEFWKRLLSQIDLVSATWYRQPLTRGLRRAEQWMDGEVLPFHFSHGDFAPWNMKLLRNKIVVFDWEHASRVTLPAWDLFHFMFEVMRVQRRSPQEMCTSFLTDGVFLENVGVHFASIGLATELRERLLFLYLLARLASRAVEAPGHVVQFQELQTLVQLLQMLDPAE